MAQQSEFQIAKITGVPQRRNVSRNIVVLPASCSLCSKWIAQRCKTSWTGLAQRSIHPIRMDRGAAGRYGRSMTIASSGSRCKVGRVQFVKVWLWCLLPATSQSIRKSQSNSEPHLIYNMSSLHLQDEANKASQRSRVSISFDLCTFQLVPISAISKPASKKALLQWSHQPHKSRY